MTKSKSKSATPKGQPVSAFTLFNKSTAIVGSHLSSFVTLYLLPTAVSVGTMVAVSKEADKTKDLGLRLGLPTYLITRFGAFGGVLFTVVVVGLVFVSLMLYCLQLQAAQGKSTDISDIWALGLKYGLRLIGLALVIAVYVIGGLILLLVPGLIMLRRYYLAPFVMIDKDVSIGEAMRQSAELTKPYTGSIWGLLGISLLLTVPSIFLAYVGPYITLVLVVMYSVAPALRYEELKKLPKA